MAEECIIIPDFFIWILGLELFPGILSFFQGKHFPDRAMSFMAPFAWGGTSKVEVATVSLP